MNDDLNETNKIRLSNRIDNIIRNNSSTIDRTYYYHYSNFENLDKIVKQYCYKFKMTNYKKFKDKLEGKLIIELYNDVLEQIYKENSIDDKLYYFLNTIRLNDEGIVKVSKDLYDWDEYLLFVMCFSTKINDKNMWNNYGNDGGNTKICLVVPSNLFNTQFMFIDQITSPKIYDRNYKLQSVIYDRNEQIKKLKESILKHVNFCKTDNGNNPEIYLKMNIIEDLQYFQLMFKDNKFSKENEFRLIYKLSKRLNDEFIKDNKDANVYLKILDSESKLVLFKPIDVEFTNKYVENLYLEEIADYDM